MLIRINYGDTTPIYLQIRNEIILCIANGLLLPGDRLPTVRALALESGVNSMTVNKAYQLLKSEGYIETDRRFGAVVAKQSRLQPISEDTKDALYLLLSQLRVNGLTKEEILTLCGELLTKPAVNAAEGIAPALSSKGNPQNNFHEKELSEKEVN